MSAPHGTFASNASRQETSRRDRVAAALIANGMPVALMAAAWFAEAHWTETYYRGVGEDGPVEWATFWAFVVGMVGNVLLAARAIRGGFAATWYKAGVALLCFLVAGEEISWGQRLLGYRPPEYFLAHNVQLEANLHNLVRPVVWNFGIEAILAGFGVVLPLLLLAERPRAIAHRIAVYVPPASWAPGFAVLLAFYIVHPFRLCEEVIELGLGLGLALAALWRNGEESEATRPGNGLRRPLALLGAVALTAALGITSAFATGSEVTRDDGRVAQARAELEALRQDFLDMRRERGGRFVTQCNINARLHTIDSHLSLATLHGGEFARVAGRSSAERARYLLDPWEMPYWVSDECDSAARYILLYSFGPDRRRDSTPWATGGDDVGVYVFHLGTPRPGDWHELAFPELP